MPNTSTLIESGNLPFTIESRIIRELGERLVKEPEIALLELIKNSYDADATKAQVSFAPGSITVTDDGVGMTIDEFKNGWMRIGTSSKELRTQTRVYARPVSGEKGSDASR
jgi:HSP90 family molecular chaperone